MKNKRKLIGVYDYTVILTYLSLVSAVIGMMMAVKKKFTFSVLCLVLSGICDAFDGIVARSKKDRTEEEKAFGIQLDSLCDVIAFGFFPAFFGYFIGTNGIIGVIIVCLYCVCAVCRLAFFNVLEGKRQKEEDGCAKYYRGLPVTSISIILPIAYVIGMLMSETAFTAVIHILLLVTSFLFVFDFRVPKPDWKKILTGK